MPRARRMLGALGTVAGGAASAGRRPNDACAGAAAIPDAGPFPYLSAVYDVAEATTGGDPATPACQTSVSRGVWFRFAPAVTTDYYFSLGAYAPTGTTLAATLLPVSASS